MKVRGVEKFVAPIPTCPCFGDSQVESITKTPCKESDFALPFGESFQNYVGEEMLAKSGLQRVTHRFLYTKNPYITSARIKKNTVDWIVSNKKAALFVEAKTKRLRIDAKVEIFSQETLIQEIGKMAEFIA